MDFSEDARLVPLERSKWRMYYMARYSGAKPQIVQLAGKKYLEIYVGRGFEEITREEFKRLVPIVKQAVYAMTAEKVKAA